MAENIRISLRGIWSHKMRSFLTMLGIIIGIAAIIAIVSTIKGTNEQIKNNLIGSGTNAVTLQIEQDGNQMDFSYDSVPDGLTELTEDVKTQLQGIGGAEAVSFYHWRQGMGDMYYLNNSLTSDSLYGIDADYISAASLQVTAGRGFGDADFTGNRKVALIDETVKDSAFGDTDPLGKSIDIAGEPFTIVGIVKQKKAYEPVINSVNDYYMYSGDQTGRVYIPDQMWPTVCRYDEPQNVLIRAASTDEMTSVGRNAEDIVNNSLGLADGSVKYASQDLTQAATQMQQLSRSSNIMLIGIASISLLVGGIGVMNIMLVSVTERTREIGLKKALGAKKRTIRAQFLTEAAILSMIGGVIGVVAGIVLARIIAFVAQVPVAISVPAILIAVVFSMAVGIIFGLVPSVKAANLNPIDALRYE